MEEAEWIMVPVPKRLVGDVVRWVSDQLDEAGADTTDSDVPTTDEDGWAWWQTLDRGERELLVALVARGADEVDSFVVADDLAVSTRQLGGIVGPLNKRMRQDKYRPPVRSRQAVVAGKRVKRLSVEPGYLPFIGQVVDPEVPKKVVVRRPVGAGSARRPAKNR